MRDARGASRPTTDGRQVLRDTFVEGSGGMALEGSTEEFRFQRGNRWVAMKNTEHTTAPRTGNPLSIRATAVENLSVHHRTPPVTIPTPRTNIRKYTRKKARNGGIFRAERDAFSRADRGQR